MTDLAQISGIPLYIVIREKILTQIKNNEIQAGEKIPTEEELAKKYGVSRMTVRQALHDLVSKGLLLRKRGVGTFIVTPHMTRHYTRLTSFFEEAQEQNLHPSSRLLDIAVIQADNQLAEKLLIQPGEQVIRVVRLRLLNGEPIAINVAHIPHKHFPGLLEEKLEDQSLYRLYINQGLEIVWASQRIEARVADKQQAELLAIKPRDPILYSERTTYTHADIPIEWVQAYASGAPYAIEITLYRDQLSK